MIAYNELIMREPPLQAGRDCCLFPDIDGTLVDIAPTTHDVRVDESRRLLPRPAERVCRGGLGSGPLINSLLAARSAA